jgi:hypothetical protein
MSNHRFFPAIVLLLALCVSAQAGDAISVDSTGNTTFTGNVTASGQVTVSGQVAAPNVLQGTSGSNVSGNVTLSATAFGNWHWITGPSDFTITLPTAVNQAGKVIGFRVRDASVAPKTYTLAALTGQLIDGVPAVPLNALSTLIVMSDGQGWAQLTGAGTSAKLPNKSQLFATPGAQTWTPPAGVVSVWVYLRGAGGGAGGARRTYGYGPAYSGARGGFASATAVVSPGVPVAIVVGGGGGGGYPANFGDGGGGGGGGGGASSFNGAIFAGGGGGGAGAPGNAAVDSGVGGSGGNSGGAGGPSWGGSGGGAGVGGTTSGGAGAAANSNGGPGGSTLGGNPMAPFSPPSDQFDSTLYGLGGVGQTSGDQWPGPAANGTSGAVFVMWRE